MQQTCKYIRNLNMQEIQKDAATPGTEVEVLPGATPAFFYQHGTTWILTAHCVT